MEKHKLVIPFCFLLSLFMVCLNGYSQSPETIVPQHKVTLPESHLGSREVDTRLLESYGSVPANIREFYLFSRDVFSGDVNACFSHPEIIGAAQNHEIPVLGGPMLGRLSDQGVHIWIRPAGKEALLVEVSESDGSEGKVFQTQAAEPGMAEEIEIDGLSSNTSYKYSVRTEKNLIAEGRFTTAPKPGEKGIFRVCFGSCFHKIGLHNPNLADQILKRKPGAMMLIGDIAVDDRENQMNMHRSDYLLRDLSEPWQKLAANVPLYTSWDDHDYLNNDLSGIPEGFTRADRKALRAMWQENWNNPPNKRKGIYFNTHIGPVELITLDTRSCRNISKRGQLHSYLGRKQLRWLKTTLKNSEAPFKIISSGTMWSDYVSNGKDSWGTWDTLAREELFTLIEEENIPGVLLISGDRHGARGFTIPRPSGHLLHEFEVATLGGVGGPDAMAQDSTNQLFGYHGIGTIAFGEFTFNTLEEDALVTFRLINESGTVLEEHILPYNKLIPKGI